jgi:hypothetical protein
MEGMTKIIFHVGDLKLHRKFYCIFIVPEEVAVLPIDYTVQILEVIEVYVFVDFLLILVAWLNGEKRFL